jgi:hypothetical protein
MQQIEAVIKRANAGDESVVPELQDLLKRLPAIAGPLGGNLARHAEKLLVKALAHSNLAVREALLLQLEQLRDELGEPTQGPLERLLVDRVVLCWLHVHYADYQYALAAEAALQYREFLQRQQDRAQRRYLAAIKSLSTIRRLLRPIQFDISVTDGRIS